MNFREMLDEHGIIYKNSTFDVNEVMMCCLFCEQNGQAPDNRFRLGVNVATDQGHCFNCEWKSRDATRLIAEVLGATVTQRDVAGQGEATEAPDDAPTPTLPEDFMLFSKAPRTSFYMKAWRYLKERGVADWQIEEKQVGVSMTGQYAYRIIFPIYFKKELQGFVGRDFTGQQKLPYLNMPGNKSLYNLPKDVKNNKAVLCEGIFDCLAIEQVVLRTNYNVMAVLGRTLTELQEQQIADYRDVILWPDADIPGIKGFVDLAKHLNMEHRVFIVPPFGYGKDASATKKVHRAYIWATRTRFTDSLELKLRAEAAFHDD